MTAPVGHVPCRAWLPAPSSSKVSRRWVVSMPSSPSRSTCFRLFRASSKAPGPHNSMSMSWHAEVLWHTPFHLHPLVVDLVQLVIGQGSLVLLVEPVEHMLERCRPWRTTLCWLPDAETCRSGEVQSRLHKAEVGYLILPSTKRPWVTGCHRRIPEQLFLMDVTAITGYNLDMSGSLQRQSCEASPQPHFAAPRR